METKDIVIIFKKDFKWFMLVFKDMKAFPKTLQMGSLQSHQLQISFIRAPLLFLTYNFC